MGRCDGRLRFMAARPFFVSISVHLRSTTACRSATRSGGCRARRCALIGERLEAEQARQATVEKIEARPKLLARIGIHSGAVVVGAGGGFLLISTENEVRN